MDRMPHSGTKIVYEDRSVTFRHKNSIWIGCHVLVPGYYMRIRVSRSDTRIEYGSGVTFRHQYSMMRIRVSRSGTRISKENAS